MSEDETIDPADSDKLVAAEYVSGVLGAAERGKVELRFSREPALASEWRSGRSASPELPMR
jgi:anti-sigma-K factor RskA